MMLTKEECLEALTEIKMYGSINIPLYSLEVIENLIDEHFSNPPLYMDEIPKCIWIWDNVNKECIRSLGCVELDGIIYVKFERSENSFITNYLEYEPNRFYRKEVRNVK